jgi:hypothetical protein
LNPKNSITAARRPETPITAEGSAGAKMEIHSAFYEFDDNPDRRFVGAHS